MLTNAAPREPVQALGRGISSIDDPMIKKLKRQYWDAHEDKMDAWRDQVEQYLANTQGMEAREEFRKDVLAGRRAERTMTPKERSDMFFCDFYNKVVSASLLAKLKVWMVQWDKTPDDITALAAEFSSKKDIRRYELETSSDPEIKMRIELAFLWLTFKDELATSIMRRNAGSSLCLLC